MTHRENGRLLYDSARTGAAVQTRAGFVNERTLLFRSYDYCVDLFAPSGSDTLHWLHGQVIRSMASQPVPGALVRLGQDAQPVETDEHGQFAGQSVHAAGFQSAH